MVPLWHFPVNSRTVQLLARNEKVVSDPPYPLGALAGQPPGGAMKPNGTVSAAVPVITPAELTIRSEGIR